MLIGRCLAIVESLHLMARVVDVDETLKLREEARHHSAAFERGRKNRYKASITQR